MAGNRDHDSIRGGCRMSQGCQEAESNGEKPAAQYSLDTMPDYDRSTPLFYQEASEQKCPAIDELEWLNKDRWDVIRSCGRRAEP